MDIIKEGYKRLLSQGVQTTLVDSYLFLRNHPSVVRLIVAIRYVKYRYVNGYSALADPFKILWVDPDKIEKKNPDIDKYWETGKIDSGDWDKNTVQFDQTPKYRSVVQRYIEGNEWEETEIFETLSDKIRSSNRVDGCQSIDELEQRYERIDQVYRSIQTDGYQYPQPGEYSDRYATKLDQVCVSIGRTGDFVFSGGGNHRLAIAKVLNIKAIPVRVIKRHRDWQERRERLVATGKQNRSSHPDLEDLQ